MRGTCLAGLSRIPPARLLLLTFFHFGLTSAKAVSPGRVDTRLVADLGNNQLARRRHHIAEDRVPALLVRSVRSTALDMMWSSRMSRSRVDARSPRQYQSGGGILSSRFSLHSFLFSSKSSTEAARCGLQKKLCCCQSYLAYVEIKTPDIVFSCGGHGRQDSGAPGCNWQTGQEGLPNLTFPSPGQWSDWLCIWADPVTTTTCTFALGTPASIRSFISILEWVHAFATGSASTKNWDCRKATSFWPEIVKPGSQIEYQIKGSDNSTGSPVSSMGAREDLPGRCLRFDWAEQKTQDRSHGL